MLSLVKLFVFTLVFISCSREERPVDTKIQFKKLSTVKKESLKKSDESEYYYLYLNN